MRPQTLADTLSAFIDNGVIAYIEGEPGIGKTEICKAVVEAKPGYNFILKHVPSLQPEDNAIPGKSDDGERLKFLIADWIPLVGDDSPDFGVICLDELAQAPNDIQKTLGHMILEREVYGRKIKPGYGFIATGNRPEHRSGANRLLTHLRARLTPLSLDVHLDDWCSWAIDHGVDPMLIAFLRFKPGLLTDFNAHVETNPNPRSWVRVSEKIIGKVPTEAEFECIKGCVGEGPAAEFSAFLKIYRKLPNPDAVLMDPANAAVPTDPSTLYAIAGAIGHRATQDNFENVITYAKRLPAEFMVLVVRDAIKRDKGIQNSKAFTSWAAKEGAKVLM